MRNISEDRTLPSEFYLGEDFFELVKDRVFGISWHYCGTEERFEHQQNLHPVNILPDYMDEPVVITREREGAFHCVSNVCTHRGSLVVPEPSGGIILRCPYHGRCFGLDGSFRSMPGFEGVEDFPTETDHLTRLDIDRYGPMLFAKLRGQGTFGQHFEVLFNEMQWFDPTALEHRAEASQVYHVEAHWALYVDNYLEGFHVPFVHPGLNDALDVNAYSIECYPNAVLQVGYADDGEELVLQFPEGSRYHGERIYALYWWIFPNLMFNFYPWGISLNVVEPIGPAQTRIRFETYVRKGLSTPDVSSIHQTEIEDERIVELVQQGIRSSFYRTGRYSPQHETGVQHFHTMLRNHLPELAV